MTKEKPDLLEELREMEDALKGIKAKPHEGNGHNFRRGVKPAEGRA